MGEVCEFVSIYDDICRTEAVLHHGVEAEFLKFVQSHQQHLFEIQHGSEELKLLKQEHEVTLQELGHWKANFQELKNAFKLEEMKRKQAETAASDLVQIIQKIKEVVNWDDTLTDETKECFNLLKTYEQLYIRNENEAAEPNVDFDKSGEVLDFETSSPLPSSSGKQIRNDTQTLGFDLPVDIDPKYSESELFVTGTSLAVPGNKPSIPTYLKLDLMRQESVPVTPPFPLENKRRSRSEPEPIIPEKELQQSVLDPVLNTTGAPKIWLSAEQDSPDTVFSSSTPRTLNSSRFQHNSGSKLTRRPHELAMKIVIKPEACIPCGRKIKFSKHALRCHNCHIICHPECRSSLPLPCIAIERTPNKLGKTVSDFAPTEPPRIPSIIVLCVNEVEARGKNEPGLYRISAPEREILAVKDKFFKSKGWPNLRNAGVHLLCATIKDFLRHLEPLIPKLTWKEFASAAVITDVDESQTALYQCIGQLPLPNRDTLAFLILHWLRVAANPNIKMPVRNLAMVLGPTIVGFSSQDLDPETMLMEQSLQVKVMEKLLQLPSDFWNSFINEKESATFTHDISTASSKTAFFANSTTSNLQRGKAVRGAPHSRQLRLFTSPNP